MAAQFIIIFKKDPDGPAIYFEKRIDIENRKRVLRIVPKDNAEYVRLYRDLKSQKKFFNIDLRYINEDGDFMYYCTLQTVMKFYNDMIKSDWEFAEDAQAFFFGDMNEPIITIKGELITHDGSTAHTYRTAEFYNRIWEQSQKSRKNKKNKKNRKSAKGSKIDHKTSEEETHD